MAVAIYLRGHTPYLPLVEAMERWVDARARDEAPDLLLFVEHQPTITLGRAKTAPSHVLDPGPLPVVPVSRGGDATLHGPGQLLALPILALPQGRRDLVAHMRNLESAVIELLRDLGLRPTTDPRNTGVWLPQAQGEPQKVAAIGIACRRWVTWHGLALNLQIDLANFERIQPCGLDLATVTRLSDHLDPCPTPAECAPILLSYLARSLQVSIEGPLRTLDGPAQLLAALEVQR